MALVVTTNTAALAGHRTLSASDTAMGRALERLSSGQRINRAADDAAGLAISEGLRSQLGGMRQALRNTLDGISVVQTAEGALHQTTAVLQRLRDLSVQAANTGALDADAQDAVQREVAQLKTELTRIADTTSFNGRPLLDGSYRGVFQVGANVGETITVTLGSPGAAGSAPGPDAGFDVTALGLDELDVTATGGTSHTATVTPAVSAAQGTPASGRLRLDGDFATAGAYPASFAALRGTLTYEGRTMDLGAVDFTGAVTATDHLARLNAVAIPLFGFTFTPFTSTPGGLYFTGEVPGAGSTAADAAAMTPTYAGSIGASEALGLIDQAVARISSTRASLGAVQNRLEHTIARLGVAIENTAASESRIRDTDMAAEMTVFTRNQVLTQASTAMLAQATKGPEAVLRLLG